MSVLAAGKHAIAILALMSTICCIVGLAAYTGLILSDHVREVADPDARAVFGLLSFGLPAMALAFCYKTMALSSKPVLFGTVAGICLGLAIVIVMGVEIFNGRSSDHGHVIVQPILGMDTFARGRGYALKIKDEATSETYKVLWGFQYPEGWRGQGRCLQARVGKGSLGLRWIGERAIVECPASSTSKSG